MGVYPSICGMGGVGKNKDSSHVLRKNKDFGRMRDPKEGFKAEIMDQKWQKFQKNLPPASFFS